MLSKAFCFLVKSFYKVNTVQYEEGADEYFKSDSHYAPFGKTQYVSQKQSQKENPQNKVHAVNGFFSENTAFNENYYDNYSNTQKVKTESKSFRNTQSEGVRRKPERGVQKRKYFQNTENSSIPSFRETDLKNSSFDIASFRPSSFSTF